VPAFNKAKDKVVKIMVEKETMAHCEQVMTRVISEINRESLVVELRSQVAGGDGIENGNYVCASLVVGVKSMGSCVHETVRCDWGGEQSKKLKVNEWWWGNVLKMKWKGKNEPDTMLYFMFRVLPKA
jgi:hypothetical protein